MGREKGKNPKLRFGEILLEYGIITRGQLRKALDRQGKFGGRIGSILKEMGYLDDAALLNFLSKQFNTSPVNLFEIRVPPSILKLLPFEKVKAFKVLPLKEAGDNVTLAMVNPTDMDAIQDVEFALGLRVDPAIVPSYQMERAITYFEEKGYGRKAFEGELLKEEISTVESETPDIHSMFKLVLEHKATDLHITAGVPPSVRVDNEIKRLPLPKVTPEQMKRFIQEILTKEQQEVFIKEREIDLTLYLPDIGRFRVGMYKQRNSISLAARYIREDIPCIKDLGLPEWIKDYALKKQGFILVTGPAGHGKAATIAALIDVINSTRKCNIVTLEDPIRYLHKHKKSNVNQREIGVDTESFTIGLKHICSQDPDVMVIGEMRDHESISTALTAAKSGRLVISTLHSLNATTAIDRIIEIFPERQHHQVRLQFADSFLLVFAQMLIPEKRGEGRVLAYEKIANSNRVRNLIRQGKIHNIRSFMQAVSTDLMSIDQSLAKLCRSGKIAFEEGLKFADNPSYYRELVKKAAPR